MALRWLLASPEFVLRVERDPAGAAPGSTYPVSDLELASRLSFFLGSSIPDDELLDAAVAGRLRDPVELERQTRRMLADDRARALVTSFASQWLHLRNVPAVVPDEDRFPDVGEALRRAMRRETELFVDSDCRWRGALDARGHRAPPRQSGLRELPPADALIASFVCRNARGERYARPPVWLLAGTLGLSVVIFAGDRLFTEAPDSPLASAAIVALAQYGIPTGMFLVGRTAGTWLAPRLRVYAQLAEYLRVMWIPIGGFAAGYLAIILVFAGFCGSCRGRSVRARFPSSPRSPRTTPESHPPRCRRGCWSASSSSSRSGGPWSSSPRSCRPSSRSSSASRAGPRGPHCRLPSAELAPPNATA